MKRRATNPVHLPARRLSVGAEVCDEGVEFRIWAPRCKHAHLVFEEASSASLKMLREDDGYFSVLASSAEAGSRYWFQLNRGEQLLPDPASRYQPGGCLGPSLVVDPKRYEWHDQGWHGLNLDGLVLYEMHVGTHSPSGDWFGAQQSLPRLADLGITAIELMPIAQFPGQFGWSYDPAHLFAPTRLYGTPDELRRFVDTAHQHGVGVILDVIYNHLGRVGEQLMAEFAPEFFTDAYRCEWGRAVNFDQPASHGVRAFVLDNIRYWIEEFHMDGFRIDAAQAIFDQSPFHILLEISRAARTAAGDRRVLVIGEDEPQHVRLVRSAQRGSYELDAVVNDDFHHAAMVRLTGRREAYYTDYKGDSQEFVDLAKWGYLFQGQRYSWQKNPRGTPALDIAAPHFVNCLENHDQLANSHDGARVHRQTSPGRYRAMTALWLLSPQTPMFFQGQEYGATTPFFYFNDAPDDEADIVRRGRQEFLSQFPSLAALDAISPSDPCAPETFVRSRLNPNERSSNQQWCDFHRDLLKLRRDDPVLRIHNSSMVHGATIGSDALALRYLSVGGDARLLVVNFGTELNLPSIATPLAAPPSGTYWRILWSSESPRYGRPATPEVFTSAGMRVSGESAVLLWPQPIEVEP